MLGYLEIIYGTIQRNNIDLLPRAMQSNFISSLPSGIFSGLSALSQLYWLQPPKATYVNHPPGYFLSEISNIS